MSVNPPRRSFAGVLLGPSGRERHRVIQVLLALGLYVAFAAVRQAEVALGLMNAGASNLLTAVNLAVALLFYGLVRSGLSRRISRDPTLTLPQVAFGLCSAAWTYSITGPARGVMVCIMILVILFGMFSLSARQSLASAGAAFVMLALAMAWRSSQMPGIYDPRVEVVNLACAAIVVTASTLLSIRLGQLRARLTAQKMELERALELNRQLAACDPLTGLPNRRAMTALLAREALGGRRIAEPMALAVLDIDWFKQINDTYGHRTGDAVLQRFAELARMELRADDVLARWGGEEFLMIMPGTRRDHAHAAMDRMRLRMAEGGFERLATGLRVSFSAGITECSGDEPYANAIERADQALYQAKKSGRNRIQSA
jgi:diguanylate cyclase (GGDEF)-like protein